MNFPIELLATSRYSRSMNQNKPLNVVRGKLFAIAPMMDGSDK
jgi:hypothetical protein